MNPEVQFVLGCLGLGLVLTYALYRWLEPYMPPDCADWLEPPPDDET